MSGDPGLQDPRWRHQKSRGLSTSDIDNTSIRYNNLRPENICAIPWRAFCFHLYGRRRLFRIARRYGIVVSIVFHASLAVLVFLIAHALWAPSYTRLPSHYRELELRCASSASSHRHGCANKHAEKVFISVSLYDHAGDLAGGQWGQRLLDLIELIGTDNVFLSVYENDSGPNGRAALTRLESQLKCRHNFVNDEHVSLDNFPTVTLPDGSQRVKRTVYLSEMRNRALHPLDTLDANDLGTSSFDKILFLNDVLFDPIEAAHLLFSTNHDINGRTNYLAACALDYYFDPIMYYDTYALRDADGFQTGEQVFPIFSSAGRGISRAAMVRQMDAVPVKSCWGGIVAMQAKYVQGNTTASSSLTRPHSTNAFSDPSKIHSTSLDNDAPQFPTTPVRFRGESEIYYDACECCLFLADVTHAALTDPDRSPNEPNVVVNPYIRTAYSPTVFALIPWAKLWERLLIMPQRTLTSMKHKPIPNPYRTVAPGDDFLEEVWRQHDPRNPGSGTWEPVARKGRSGLFCGIRNMQVMRDRKDGEGGDGEGSSWETVPIPAGQKLFRDTGYQ